MKNERKLKRNLIRFARRRQWHETTTMVTTIETKNEVIVGRESNVVLLRHVQGQLDVGKRFN